MIRRYFEKRQLTLVTFFLLLIMFPLPLQASEKDLFSWDEGEGENWPGWKYSKDVDYGHPGWTMVSGENYKWGYGPRCFEKGSYGSRSLAKIDPDNRAPSTSRGGSFKVYENPAFPEASHLTSWWVWYDGKPLKSRNIAKDDTDRWSFYIKLEGIDPISEKELKEEIKGENFHVGTYLGWENPGGKSSKSGDGLPYEGPGNQHYYHYFRFNPGAWIHVLLDNHPQHLRDKKGNTLIPNNPSMVASGKNYMAYLIQWYLEIRRKNEKETSFNLDEMKFFSTKETPEPNQNDISISSVWIGYWENQNYWEMSWYDGSFESLNDNTNSVFEIRYSTSPITNQNYASATPITPIFYRAGNTNLVRKANPWRQIVWTRFKLPEQVEKKTNRIFFAIKDVSQKGEHRGTHPYKNGDGHNAPSPLIHTIDYFLRPEDSTIKQTVISKPAAPKNLRIMQHAGN